MSFSLNRARTLGIGACCAAAGLGAGAVATATASSGSGSSHHAKSAHHAKGHGERRAILRAARRTATGQAVVHTKAGYKTIAWERGTVQSVSGDQITLAEGVSGSAYKTETVTVPANARVRDNGKKASLASVSAGQRALIVQLPKRTVVIARTPKAGAAS